MNVMKSRMYGICILIYADAAFVSVIDTMGPMKRKIKREMQRSAMYGPLVFFSSL